MPRAGLEDKEDNCFVVLMVFGASWGSLVREANETNSPRCSSIGFASPRAGVSDTPKDDLKKGTPAR